MSVSTRSSSARPSIDSSESGQEPCSSRNAATARALYLQLAAFAAGGPLFLDAPENNPAAMAMVKEQQMTEVFGCARMYLGQPPALRHARIYGVTTFELG